MINLGPEPLATVHQILASEVSECEVRAFGSRVNGNPKPYSDLDIVVQGPARLPIGRLAALREAFAESDLRIRVDVIDWHASSQAFQIIIASNFEILQRPAIPAPATVKSS